MKHAVIDTNVLLVANNSHPDTSEKCIIDCITRLQAIQKSGIVVIDDAWKIINEYSNKTHPNQPRGAGDVFLKWLMRNQSNPDHVEQVTITEKRADFFNEFPAPGLQTRFDAPDRKFAAVANAHPAKPPVWQAADCKWLDWWKELHAAGIKVEFLCPTDVCGFYQHKFPKKSIPDLPDEQ